MFASFISLFYPDICAACGDHLVRGEDKICTSCKYHLPRTDFHAYAENPLVKHFWGKVKVEAAASFYYFNKGEKVQRLIHNFKYRKQKELGILIGNMYGAQLKDSHPFDSVDYVIPVPLHTEKKIKRGFNQSEMFAIGLAEGMHSECKNDILVRSKFSETQTRKNRFQRWTNVKEIFSLSTNDLASFSGCHFLLADDVVTTGSTLEASARVLLQIPGARVSIATIAYANS